MEKYLYGSVVNKIQKFIFETGKLKEIIGASEWIERICDSEFKKAVGATFSKENLIVSAAGKVTYLFEDQLVFQDFLVRFHKHILSLTPHLQITQAAVKVHDHPSQVDFQELERRLTINKSKQEVGHGLGWMAMERSRRTGLPAVHMDQQDGYLDRQQMTKLKMSSDALSMFGKMVPDVEHYTGHFPLMLENMTRGREGEWLAVVHADGNNLGRLIQEITTSSQGKNSAKIKEILKSFSTLLDQATKIAAKDAFEAVAKPVFEQEYAENRNTAYLPLRPVLLGGDDLTLIIRGDLALPFTEKFLTAFEEQTQSLLSELAQQFGIKKLNEGLTACAGIAYIKPKYPFHYSVDLSESLCSYAKKKSKELNNERAPTCLAFHRVQSAFIEDFSSVIEKELTTNDGVSLSYGPYFIRAEDNKPTVRQLRSWVEYIHQDNAPKAPIREWLTELKINRGSADQLMHRIRSINPKYDRKLSLAQAVNQAGATHLHDVVTIANIEKPY